MNMTSRERVLRCMEFRGPDRIPLWPRIEGTAWLAHGENLAALLKRYPVDIERHALAGRGSVPERLSWTDDWGCRWQRERAGFYGTVLGHPLADPAALASYTFPDFGCPRYDAHFAELTRRHKQTAPDEFRVLGGTMEYGVLWYRLWWLRGMDEAMADTASGDGLIEELRDRVVDTQLRYLGRVLELDADGIMFGDDWGTQTGLMISPERWRELFKPAYKRIFDAVHTAGKKIIMETDGCTGAIIEDWHEIGVDLLSVQLNAVGLDQAARHRGKTCFYADPDRQHILPYGTPEMVKRHVHDICESLNTPHGGLVGCLYITEETPLANIAAALDAFLACGA